MAVAVSQHATVECVLAHSLSSGSFLQFSPPTAKAQADPERLYTKQERIGKGNFGEVFKG